METPDLVNQAGKSICILYGSHTGNGERLAKLSAKKMADAGIETEVCDMCLFKSLNLKNIGLLLIIISTHGVGEPPITASEFYQYLHSNGAPQLSHLKYAVLALGDSAYEQFCQAGKDFDAILARLGAQRICERVDCDFDFEEDYLQWIENMISKQKPSLL